MTLPSDGYLQVKVIGAVHTNDLLLSATSVRTFPVCDVQTCNVVGTTATSPAQASSGSPVLLTLDDHTGNASYNSDDPQHARVYLNRTGYVVLWNDSTVDTDFADLTLQVSAVRDTPVYGGDHPGVASPRSLREMNGSESLGELGSHCPTGDPVECSTGNLTESVTDVAVPGRGLALRLSRTYNTSTALTGAAGPFGFGWSSEYNQSIAVTPTATGLAATVTQANGATLPFTAPAPAAGALPAFTAPARVTSRLVQNATGGYTLTYADQSQLLFGSSGQLTAEVDRSGYRTTIDRNTAGDPVSVTDPAGRHLTMTYDNNRHVTTATDPAAQTVRYGYDTAGNLVTVTDRTGAVTRYGYDTSHVLTTITDAAGGITTNTTDSYHRITRQTDPAGRTTQLAYTGPFDYGMGPAGTTTITDGNGNTTVETFSGNADLTSKTRGYGTPDATTTRFTYNGDATGLPVTAVDGAGGVTTSTYDPAGNPLTVTDPAGITTSRTYSSSNDLLTATDAAGNTTTYSYDSTGHPTGSSRLLTSTGETAAVRLSYDPLRPGDLLQVTDPLNRAVTYTYDNQGDQTSRTDDLGNTTTYQHDVLGRLTSTVTARGNAEAAAGRDPAAHTTRTSYDPEGRPVSTTGPGSRTSSSTYDALGRESSSTDALDRTTRLTRNNDGQVTRTVLPDGTARTASYDNDGNRTSSTDPLGVTRYRYDALDRLTTTTDPLGRPSSRTYDSAGRVSSTIDARSRTTRYAYNSVGELTGVDFDDSTPDQTYDYDRLGHLQRMTDGSGLSTWTYDSLGRLTSSTNGAGKTLSHAYDLADDLTLLTYPDGQTARRSFDPAGRLAAVSDSNAHITSFGYDPNGQLAVIGYPNGSTSRRSYTPAGDLTSIKDSTADTTLLDLPMTRDAAGQLTSLNLTPAPLPNPTAAGTTVLPNLTAITTGTVNHDQLGQVTGVTAAAVTSLTSAAVAASTATYTYNTAQDISSRGSSAGTENLTVDAAHQLLTRSTTATTTTYTNDQLGERITSRTTNSSVLFDNPNNLASGFNYDEAGRLTAYSSPPLQLGNEQVGLNRHFDYKYDGLDRRSDLTYDAVSSGIAPPIASDLLYDYISGPGGLIIEQITAAGTPLYLHSDQIGSTRLITDQQARPLTSYTYDPYGRTTTTPLAKLTGITPTAALTPIQYAGAYTDLQGGGLIYMRARWYDPTTATFLTRDPLESFTGAVYNYAVNNPLDHSDPLGLVSITNVLDAISVATSAASSVASLVAVACAIAVQPECVFTAEAAALTLAASTLAVDIASGHLKGEQDKKALAFDAVALVGGLGGVALTKADDVVALARLAKIDEGVRTGVGGGLDNAGAGLAVVAGARTLKALICEL